MVIGNDVTVKGGTLYPLTVQKQLRAQQIALENRLACVYLVGLGRCVPPAAGGDLHAGRPHLLQRGGHVGGRASRRSPSCTDPSTAGGAYVPAMCDENVIVRGQGAIYLGGPPLVRAATGEQVTARSSAAATCTPASPASPITSRPTTRTGSRSPREALAQVPSAPPAVMPGPVEPPAEDPADLYGIVPRDPRRPYDVREVIARLVDGSRFHEFKPRYGTTLVTGFARIHGYEVGILANNGVSSPRPALKGTHFILLAGQRRVPLVFLQNITGFMVGKQYEHGGITKDGAKMVHAVATAKVPKLTVMVGASHGAGNYAMCGRSYGPRFLFSWPNARASRSWAASRRP
jgi:3-methylcrotonyl-CoA carboxylase beta subunit